MSPGKNKLLVANTGSDSLTVIDLKNYDTNTFQLYSMKEKYDNISSYRKTPKIGTHQLAVGSNPDIIYSVNSYDNSVFKIDIVNKRVEDVVYVGCYPTHIQIVNGQIYVTNSDSNSVSIIDEKEFVLIENIPVGEKPHDIKVDRSSNKIYVANSNGYSINVIHLDKAKEDKIKLDIHPLHLYLSSKKMYILSPQTNGMENSCISIFDLEKREIIQRIFIDDVIVDMATVIVKDILFTTNVSDGNLYKLDFEKNETINKYYLGGMPNNILWDEQDKLYITDIQKNIVNVFDYKGSNITNSIKVGFEPNGLIFI